MIEELWLSFAKHFGHWTLCCVGTAVVSQLIWWCCNIPYLLIEKFRWFQDYKIQKDHPNDPREVMRHWWSSVLAQGAVVPVCLLAYPLFQACNFQTGAFPPLKTMLWQFVFFNVLEDFLFFWGHKLLHVEYMFKKFHWVHHAYKAPYSVAGAQAHAVELIFNFLTPTVLPVFLAGWYSPGGVHLLLFWCWLWYRESRATEAHSGYLLPWHLSHVMKYIGYQGSVAHDIHHKYTKFNLGSFVWWDLITGTYATPSDFAKAKTLDPKAS